VRSRGGAREPGDREEAREQVQRAHHLGCEVQAGVSGREHERPDRELDEDEGGAQRPRQRVSSLEAEGEQEEGAVREHPLHGARRGPAREPRRVRVDPGRGEVGERQDVVVLGVVEHARRERPERRQRERRIPAPGALAQREAERGRGVEGDEDVVHADQQPQRLLLRAQRLRVLRRGPRALEPLLAGAGRERDRE